MAEGIGKVVSARFRALRDLFFSQKSEASTFTYNAGYWPKIFENIENGEKLVDETLAPNKVDSPTSSTLQSLTREEGPRYIAGDEDLDSPVTTPSGTEAANEETTTAASQAPISQTAKPEERENKSLSPSQGKRPKVRPKVLLAPLGGPPLVTPPVISAAEQLEEDKNSLVRMITNMEKEPLLSVAAERCALAAAFKMYKKITLDGDPNCEIHNRLMSLQRTFDSVPLNEFEKY